MKFADHNNVNIFFNLYTFELNIVDDMTNYWNKKRYTIHLKNFRELLLHHYTDIDTTAQKMEWWLNKRRLGMRRMKTRKNTANDRLFYGKLTRREILQFFHLRLWNDSFWKIWKFQSHIHTIIDTNISLRRKIWTKCEKTYSVSVKSLIWKKQKNIDCENQ